MECHRETTLTSGSVLAAEEDAVLAAPAGTNSDQDDGMIMAQAGPAQIPAGDYEEEEEYEYEYEDDEDAPFAGFLVNSNVNAITTTTGTTTTTATAAAAGHHNNADSTAVKDAPATIRDEDDTGATAVPPPPFDSNAQSKHGWRQPSRQAVSMSLRAEQETTGGKRRLAQDLYRIMNQDTVTAGFSLQPQQEDSMNHWSIKLFQFDPDSNLAKDLKVLGLDHVELEMTFPDQYPFEPPFVRVARPRFKRQTGFVMNGALCMELLTSQGWNPVNDIESVIVSIRSLLVVGDGRLEVAHDIPEARYNALLAAADATAATTDNLPQRHDEPPEPEESPATKRQRTTVARADQGGSYTASEAVAAYNHLSDYHKKKGWDNSGWWARKG